MRVWIFLTFIVSISLAACSSGVPPGSDGAEPVPPPTFESGDTEGAAVPATSSGGGAEESAVPATSSGSGAEESAVKSDVVVKQPDRRLWRSGEENADERQKDVDSCYRYARAQTHHDRQILSDQDAAFDDSSFDPSVARMQRQSTDYGLKRRERRLIQGCLEARGYRPFIE